MTTPRPDQPAAVLGMSPALERQFTPKELALLWRLSEDTIRRTFQDIPGVMKIGVPFRRGKRGYVTLRIPESVAVKLYEERSK